MVELLWMPVAGRCLRRVKRRHIGNRPGFSSWPGQPKHLSVKIPNAAEAMELRSPQEILAEIAALDAESAQVLARIGGLLG
jgi:hypothetical protein